MTHSSATISNKWLKRWRLIPEGYDVLRDAAGYYFDEKIAEKPIRFIEKFCTHIEGPLAGKPLILDEWQKGFIGAMFGWMSEETGLRRYQEVLVYIPRKNGKTAIAAALMLYVILCDNEGGAQIYSTAAEKEQAALIYRMAAGMIQNNDQLSKLCKCYKSTKTITLNNGNFYKSLTSEAETKHGFNTHMVINDEIHAHGNDGELLDVIETSMGARLQPLFLSITTADYLRASIANTKLEYAMSVATGHIKDASFLPVVYRATLEDDWKSPDVWRKANPNFGVSVREEYLKRQCEKAQNIPTYENTFKRLHLNIQTESDVRWIPLDKWDIVAGLKTEEEVRANNASGLCVVGADLSATQDLTCINYAFPKRDENGVLSVECFQKFYIPKEGLHARMRRDKVPFDVWERDGWVVTTPGDVVDYSLIRADIEEMAELFQIETIVFDPWNAQDMSAQLIDQGFDVVKLAQTRNNLTAGSKEFEAEIIDRRICPSENPVTRWCVGNVAVDLDAWGNMRPDKKKSTERIDGVAAIVNSLCYIVGEDIDGSVYEDRGIIIL